MTSDYVKQLKLTKQLEQKAKEAAKNRSAAEEHLKEAERILAQAKKMDAEVEAPEKAFKEASSLFSKKNYPGALAAAEKAIDIINVSRKLRIMEILTGSEEILKRTGEDQAVRAIINKAHALADDGKLDNAYESAKQANKLADKYSSGRIAELVETAERLVALLKKYDLGHEARHSEVSSIKKLIDKGDKQSAHEKLTQTIKEVEVPLRLEFANQEEDLRKRCDIAASLGLDPSRTLSYSTKASESFSAGNVAEAFDLIERGRSEFESTMPAQIEEASHSLQSRSDLLRENGLDVSTITKLLALAKERSTSRRVNEGMESMKVALVSIREMELRIILIRISKMRFKLALAKRLNADLSDVVDKLDEVRDSFAMGNLRNALQLADVADELIKSKINGHEDAESELDRTLRLLGQCRHFKVKVNGARELFNSSRQLALSRDLAGSIQLLKETQEKMDFALQSHFAVQILSSELDYAKALRIGADIFIEEQELDALIATVKAGEYSQAPDLIRNFNDALSTKMSGRAQSVVKSAEDGIKQYAGNIDISASIAVLREAEEAMRMGDHEKACTLAQQSLEHLKKLEIAVVEAERKKVRNLLDMLHRLRMDETAVQDALRTAKKESKSPGMELSILSSARTNAEEILKEAIYSALTDLDRSIEVAKKSGVYVARSSRLAQDGIKALQGGDLERAFLHYKEAEAEMTRNSALFTEVYDLITKLTNLTNEMESGVGPDIMESLKDAKLLFERGRYKESKEAAKICYSQIERQHAVRMVPLQLKEARDLLEVLNQVDPLSSRFEAELEAVQKLIESGDARGALAEAKKAAKRLSGTLHAGVMKELDLAKKMCCKVDDIGACTHSARNIIEKAQRLVDEKRFSDGLQAIRFARAELDQVLTLKTMTISTLEQAQASILNLDDIIDVSSPLEILGQAWAHQAAGRLGIASELAKKAFDQAMQIAEERISKMVQVLEKRALSDGLVGPELDSVLSMKEIILRRSAEGKLRESIAMVFEWEKELQRLRLDKKMAESKLEESKSYVERAKKKGLIIPSIETMSALSEKKFTEGAFEESTSLSIQVIVDTEFRIALVKKIEPMIEAMRSKVTSYGEWLPKDEILRYADEAEWSLKEGDQHQAILSLEMGSRMLDAGIDHFLSVPIAELINLGRFLPQLKMILSDVPPEVARVLKLPLNKIDVSHVTIMKKASGSLRSLLSETMERKMESVEALIDQAREVDAEVSVSETLLKKATESLKSGDLEAAFQAILDAERYIGLAESDVDDLYAKTISGQELINEGRALGLDMDEAAGLLKEASLERTDFRRAVGQVRKAEGIANEIVQAQKPKVKVSLQRPPVSEPDGWVRTALDVENESDFLARDLAMKFAEKVEVRDLVLPEVLRAREKKQLEAFIRSTNGSDHILMEITYRPLTSNISLASILSMDLPIS